MAVFRPVALAAVALFAALAPPAAAAPPPDFFGVNGQFLRSRDSVVPAEAWPSHLTEMRRIGIGLVRSDSQWQAVEPLPPVAGRHVYDWTRVDGLVGDLARHGLRWWPIVGYSARWASITGSYKSAPTPGHYDDYAAFAAALARRYGRDGEFWREHPELPALPVTEYEIWNEPSGMFFWLPAPDPAGYADLYLEARNALRRVDPRAKAVIAGLQFGSGPQFLREMADARPEIARRADAVGVHPYRGDLANVLGAVRTFRTTVDEKFHRRLRLAITEVGWSTTGSRSVPDGQRGTWMRELATILPGSNCGVRWLIPHTWVTPEENPLDRQDGFGIYNHDATPKGAGSGYEDGIAKVRAGYRWRGRICEDGGTPTPPP